MLFISGVIGFWSTPRCRCTHPLTTPRPLSLLCPWPSARLHTLNDTPRSPWPRTDPDTWCRRTSTTYSCNKIIFSPVLRLGIFYSSWGDAAHNNSDWSFGCGANSQSWGRGGSMGSGMVPFERAKVSSYRLPIVTFSPSLRVSEILPLLCSRTPFFPPHLYTPQSFPRFPWE